MAALYSVDTNALRSGKVKALSPEEFAAQQIVAEGILGLDAPAVTAARSVEFIEMAVVAQMNFQVEQGIGPLFKAAMSSTQSKESAVYRDRFINPIAVSLVDSAYAIIGVSRAAGRFATLTSHRTE